MPTASDVQKLQKFYKTGMPGPHAYVVLLGMAQFDWPGVLAAIEKGLPFSALERFQRNSKFTTEQIIEFLQIPRRTLARRKTSGKFSAEESDRLVRVARVFATALHLFGDADSTTEWLQRTQHAFGGERPIDMIKTEVGANEVERLVFQIENGVFP